MTEENTYYKSPKTGIVYRNGKGFITPLCRLDWVYLDAPKAGGVFDGKKAKDKYQATLLFTKEDKETKTFIDKLAESIKEMTKIFNEGNPTKILIEEFLKDGDKMDLKKYPRYEGVWLLRGTNDDPVTVVDRLVEAIPATSVEGGMFAIGKIQPYIHAKGVSFKLEALQIGKDDGVRFPKVNVNPTDGFSAFDVDDDSLEKSFDDLGSEPKKGKKGKDAALAAI